nr:energy-coupling factor transporter transmembrane protein EcfT [Actinomycetota bacterium]
MISSRRRRQAATFVPLRHISGDSPVHRLWAGTKLVAVGAIGVTLSFFPWWAAGVLMAVFLAVVVRVARIPRGAWPRLPVWFYVALLVGGAVALVAGGPPALTIGGVHI